ncbi:MAG: hypothetical protein L0027_11445 [Candidatus Rokubacteria bacterium]|nr:hypothetical protein [Candidatus Rokubacteria bacterium]
MSRTTKELDGGAMLVIQDRAPDSDAATTMAAELVRKPPPGFHFWRMELQRSDRGRRTTVRVWFRRNLPASAAEP